MLGGLLKKLVGDKSATDRKKYQPVIDQVSAIFPGLSSLTDDELRAKTDGFRAQVKAATDALETEVSALREKANDIALPLHEKEAIYEQIDAKEKEINEVIEQVAHFGRTWACFRMTLEAKRWLI